VTYNRFGGTGPKPGDENVDKGAQLGHYEIVAALGKGGMGEVYLAQDTRLDRRVAFR
jgi:serine/threonine protein kinase